MKQYSRPQVFNYIYIACKNAYETSVSCNPSLFCDFDKNLNMSQEINKIPEFKTHYVQRKVSNWMQRDTHI